MEGTNPTPNPAGTEGSNENNNEQLLAVQQELKELKDLQYQALVKELDIDNNYLDLVDSQIDKTKKIDEIKSDLSTLLTKYPKFKNMTPVTGGVVTKKDDKPNPKPNKNEKQFYNGLTPQALKMKLKEGK